MFSEKILHGIRIEARHFLEKACVDSPALCVDVLLCHVFGFKRTDLVLERGMTLDERLEEFEKLIQRRATGEPLAYIIGSREFYGRDFLVTADTLIPRPETELLVECALAEINGLKGKEKLTFLDAGTGSGCIAITMLTENEKLQGISLDMSAGALSITKKNAQMHGVYQRLQCVQGDFTTPLIKPASLDCYLSNPPYISQAEYDALSPEVRKFEPATALIPGPSGLEHAQAIIAHATKALKAHGIFLMEFGYTQGSDVAQLFTPYANAWEHVEIKQDLAGLDRFVFARRTL